MKRALGLFVAVVGLFLLPEKADAVEVQLVPYRLARSRASAPANTVLLTPRLHLLDAGGGGSFGGDPSMDYLMEGLASIGTQIVAVLVVVIALTSVLVGLESSGQAATSPNVALGIIVGTVVVGSLFVSLASTGVVTWMARNRGASPSFWGTWLMTLGANVLFGFVARILPITVLTYGAFLAVTAVQVYAANFMFQSGSGGGAGEPTIPRLQRETAFVAQTQAPLTATAAGPRVRTELAASVPLLAMTF